MDIEDRIKSAINLGWKFRWTAAGCHVTDPNLHEDDPGKTQWYAWEHSRLEVLEQAQVPQ